MIFFLRAALISALALLSAVLARAGDMTWTYAVQMSATISADPARIELNWPGDPFPISGYTVHRKAVGDNAWGEGVPVSGDATRFTDENVETGKVYEYQIVKRGPTYTGYGYIAVAINAHLNDQRGRVILLVDDTFSGSLSGEIARLQTDLAGDGWVVARHDVSRSASPHDVRALIKREYDADRERTRAVFLLGRIPIVRSGNLNVDGHGSRPMPADVFYGDVDGEWTDLNSDGILDQNLQPSTIELYVGRVDFADLPGQYSPIPYPSERDLMKRYLDKNHAFRHAAIRPKPRALIGNVVGDGNGQATAASGYRNFAALLGAENITTANSDLDAPEHDRWMPLLSQNDYLWVFGCGAGSDFTIGGLGTHPPFLDVWASDFLEKKARGTFYLAFGSWFSDWTKPDNILRTMLAAPDYGLTAAWSGRPHLYFHHMGVGEPIGYGIRLSQNNQGLYQNQLQRQLRGIHIALLGDPTLRMHQLAPPTEVKAEANGSDVTLTWKRSADDVAGYYIYRGTNTNGPFTRLTDALVTENRFVDRNRPGDATVYLVRSIALVNGPSGSFVNASQGGFAVVGSGTTSAPATTQSEPPLITLSPNGTKPTDIVWFDDALPDGATGYTEFDRWNWVTQNPAPFSGTSSHQSDIRGGLHFHFFAPANPPFVINTGDTLFAYVYLDPANPTRQIMVTWLTDTWEHRAYWGEDIIGEGVNNTASRRRIGDLPPKGEWVRLELPASAVGLENRRAIGMGFMIFDGRVTWDRAGKSRP